METYIGALDLGTTRNRSILFDREDQIAGVDQIEHEQMFPIEMIKKRYDLILCSGTPWMT